MPYPASSYPEGVDLTIIAGNQLHQVINGEANEVVSTTSGDIPSVRKALADSMMFKVPIDWVQGEVTTDPLETRLYNGQPYWAPEATLANPITLGISPVATTDWLLAPQGYRNDYNLGKYQAGILISDNLEYVVYDGKSYFAVSPPYTTTSTTPDNDVNMFEGGYTTIKSSAEVFSNTNLLPNHNFLTPSPEDITHPNATPESYVAGTQIFSGVYAGDSGCTITFIDGQVNCTAGDYQFKLPNAGGIERIPVFTSSASDYDGIPKTTGVNHSLVSDEYVVTVTPAAGDVFSVKFEQGSVATRHEVGDSPQKIVLTASGNPVFVSDDGSVNLDKSGVVGGSDVGPLITDIINSGISKRYVSNFDIEISTITFNTNNIIVKFYGDVSVTGNGAIINAARCDFMAFGKYRGTECVVNGGVLEPTPTVPSGIVMNGALNNVFIPEAYGFIRGIVHPAATSGFECNYGGHLTKCLTAVQLESVTGGAIHEGNIWNMQIFQCNNGYIVENGGNRYQRFLNVVDNVQITNGKDIVDSQGSHQIRFYFYRRTASEFNGEANVNDNLVGEARIGVESSNEFSRISSDSVILKSDDARTDMRTSSSVNDFDFREKLESGDEKHFLAKNSPPYIRALSIAYGEGALAFNQVQGAFGSDWSGFTPPTTNTNGQRVEVYNTDFPGSDNERLRIYIKSPAGWHYITPTALI